MRIRMMLAAAAAAGLMAFPVLAQDGQYGAQLRQMLDDAATGSCTEALMAPALLTACNSQIAAMSQGLQSLGAIESITFVSAQDTPGGRIESWSVKYAGGQTLVWFIGGLQPDGKFASVGTEG